MRPKFQVCIIVHFCRIFTKESYPKQISFHFTHVNLIQWQRLSLTLMHIRKCTQNCKRFTLGLLTSSEHDETHVMWCVSTIYLHFVHVQNIWRHGQMNRPIWLVSSAHHSHHCSQKMPRTFLKGCRLGNCVSIENHNCAAGQAEKSLKMLYVKQISNSRKNRTFYAFTKRKLASFCT